MWRLAALIALTACGNPSARALQDALQSHYHQPVDVRPGPDHQMLVIIAPTFNTTTTAFSPADCRAYAQDVAQFAIGHWAALATTSPRSIHVAVVGAPARLMHNAHAQGTYCTGDAPTSSAPP